MRVGVAVSFQLGVQQVSVDLHFKAPAIRGYQG